MTEDRIICGCHEVQKSTMASAIRQKGLKTVEDVSRELHLGAVCGGCSDGIKEVLHEVTGK